MRNILAVLATSALLWGCSAQHSSNDILVLKVLSCDAAISAVDGGALCEVRVLDKGRIKNMLIPKDEAPGKPGWMRGDKQFSSIPRLFNEQMQKAVYQYKPMRAPMVLTNECGRKYCPLWM